MEHPEKDRVKQIVTQFFPLCGVCRLGDISRRLQNRRQAELPAEGSVIALLLPYYSGEYPGRNLALYAVPDDYHAASCALLTQAAAALSAAFPAYRFLHFCDASPLPEVDCALCCGLGVRGDNGLLINPVYGSFCFIAEIVTDLPLPPDFPGDACEHCGACRRACPTGALSAEGFDPTRCRSALTQKKGRLSAWERCQTAKGGMVWGCDLCLLACPHNRRPKTTPLAVLRDSADPLVTRENLPALIDRKSWGWRGKAVIERNLTILEQGEANCHD